MKRRDFNKLSVTGITGVGLSNQDLMKSSKLLKHSFVHQVYFWLKDPNNKEDLATLIKGLKELSKVKTIKSYHIAVPASTRREVIDSSYSVSWLTLFKNIDDQESYQNDPLHLAFIANCSSVWSKVIVYDSVEAK